MDVHLSNGIASVYGLHSNRMQLDTGALKTQSQEDGPTRIALGLLCGAALVLTLAATSVGGQSSMGVIAGAAADSSGAPLPGVTIVATGRDQRRTTVTNGQGAFVLNEVPAGRYRIEAMLPGFQTGISSRLVAVEAGKTAQWNATLKIDLPDAMGELRGYIWRFTGRNPDDCGQDLFRAPLTNAEVDGREQMAACAARSALRRRPFWTIKQYAGIDSTIFQGLLGTREGSIYSFAYSSSDSGGQGPGSFSVRQCDDPSVNSSREIFPAFHCRR